MHATLNLQNLLNLAFLKLQHCDILRKSAEAGGLLVDAMVNAQDGLKASSPSVPLMVVENGCGSPCIDFRQVSSELAAAAKDADLVSNCQNLWYWFSIGLEFRLREAYYIIYGLLWFRLSWKEWVARCIQTLMPSLNAML